MIKIGDKLEAIGYTGFPDHTTKGQIYVVKDVWLNKWGNPNFKIINDKGELIIPISTLFTKV